MGANREGCVDALHYSGTGAIGDTLLLGESETSSFGVSDKAGLFAVDRTKAGEDMSSKKDLA
jgi:hypothetical protein